MSITDFYKQVKAFWHEVLYFKLIDNMWENCDPIQMDLKSVLFLLTSIQNILDPYSFL